MHYLKENNLVIVHVGEIEAKKEILRQQLLRKKALSPSQIVKAEFFSIKNTKSVHDWILKGKIKETEYYVVNNRTMVLTSAIKRLWL